MDTDEYQRWREPKTCFLPTCTNNDIKNPEKKFFAIRKELKEDWCDMADRYCPKRRLYCCEDHINVEEDLENYNKWIYGAKPRLKLNATLKNIPLAKNPTASNIGNVGMSSTSNVSGTFVIQTTCSPIEDLKNYFKHKLMQQEPVFKPTAKLRNIELSLEDDMENYHYWKTVKGRAKLKPRLPQSLARAPAESGGPRPNSSSLSEDIEMCGMGFEGSTSNLGHFEVTRDKKRANSQLWPPSREMTKTLQPGSKKEDGSTSQVPTCSEASDALADEAVDAAGDAVEIELQIELKNEDRHASQLAAACVSEPGPPDEVEVKTELPDELPDPLGGPGLDEEDTRDADEQISVPIAADIKEEIQSDIALHIEEEIQCDIAPDIKEEIQSDEDDTEQRPEYEMIISKMTEEMAELKSENQRLADENRRLMDENRRLMAENRIAAEKSRNLTSGIEQLLQKSENEMTDYEHICKLSDMKKVEAENKKYKEEIERLNVTILTLKSESRKQALCIVDLTERNQLLKDKTEQLQGKIKEIIASNENVQVLKELRNRIEQLEKENRQLTEQVETLKMSNESVVEQIEVSESLTDATLERVKKPTVIRGRRKRKRM